ncbi:hypothetical protein Mapa_016255 [Marchantia paleacea]|nr:hypothetical protein Mapa_016255 [Marchantia paleacea]
MALPPGPQIGIQGWNGGGLQRHEARALGEANARTAVVSVSDIRTSATAKPCSLHPRRAGQISTRDLLSPSRPQWRATDVNYMAFERVRFPISPS